MAVYRNSIQSTNVVESIINLEGSMRKFVRAILLTGVALVALVSSAHSQTVVATISGGTYTFSASKVTLASAFEQEFNDGSTVSPTTIDLVKSGSNWFLWGRGVKSGKAFTCWIALTVSGGNSYIFNGAGGMVHRCSHPACNYDPCSLPPVCGGDCNGNRVECVLISDPHAAAGYLGSFN